MCCVCVSGAVLGTKFCLSTHLPTHTEATAALYLMALACPHSTENLNPIALALATLPRLPPIYAAHSATPQPTRPCHPCSSKPTIKLNCTGTPQAPTLECHALSPASA